MNEVAAHDATPRLSEIFLEFLLVGATSFGGGTVAYQRILMVEKKRWLSEDEFMASLAIGQTMPGLNAVNLAVLCGDRLRGAAGALTAAIALLIPGCTFVLLVGIFYLHQTDRHLANILLGGVAAAATGMLSAITYRIGKKQLTQLKSLTIVIASFYLLSIARLSLPTVLAIMSPIALFMYRPKG